MSRTELNSDDVGPSPSAIDTIQKVFYSMQQKIICALEVLLPEGFDFSQLQRLFDRKVTCQLEYGMLILNLIEYFVQAVSANLIKPKDYAVLESQTQKLEAEIRNHIKIQQSVKIFLESKMRSLQKYKREAAIRRLEIQKLQQRMHDMDAYYQKEIKHICKYFMQGKKPADEARFYDWQQERKFKEQTKPKSRNGEYESTEQLKRLNRMENPADWNPQSSYHRYHSVEN